MSGAADEARRPLGPEEFRDVIGHFASGVTVITTRRSGVPHGTTANAISSLSLEPPMLLICMNKSSSTGQAVADSGRFAVNILSEDQPEEAMRFASKGDDKFSGIAITDGEFGDPLLEDALATLECRIVEEVTGGTHTVFLAVVERASARSGAPLAYFRGQFGRLELAQDEAAVRDLRGLVMSRDIDVGTPLSLDELAARLDMPRGAIYHALTKLTGDGMVTRDAGGAFVVTPLTLAGVEEGLRARLAIELGVVEITVGKASPDQIAELRALMDQSHPAPEGEFSMREYVPRYAAFHGAMVALAGSPALVDAHRRVNVPMMITSVTGARAARENADRRAADSAWRHARELVDAYEASDIAAARRTIRRHIEQSIDFTRRYMDAAGGQI